jgi:hypothetical protein
MSFLSHAVQALLHPGVLREKFGRSLAHRRAGDAVSQKLTDVAAKHGHLKGKIVAPSPKMVADKLLLRQGLDRSMLDQQIQHTFEPAHSPQLNFQTIKGIVKSLMPDTNPSGGLPHQHFFLQQEGGPLRRVDNDLKFGTKVPNLVPGEPLTIRGVLYHDDAANGQPALDGIHWTHHRAVSGDAGFIQTPDGQIFQ